MARLAEVYKNEIMPQLKEKLERENPMSVPRLEKIVISMGLGKAIQEKKRLEEAQRDLSLITGQRPIVCSARKSVSNFKLRRGYKIGLKVTLRRERMYEFLERLICVAIPRSRDFRGLKANSFDGRGNYNMGLAEQTIFPEVDADKIEFQQGMNITFVTTAHNDSEAKQLLTMLGMPFQKAGQAAAQA